MTTTTATSLLKANKKEVFVVYKNQENGEYVISVRYGTVRYQAQGKEDTVGRGGGGGGGGGGAGEGLYFGFT